jgi:DNA-binding transcriptional regulator YiaG
MRPRTLTPAQARYIRRAVALRRQLTDAALATRYGVSEDTVYAYAVGRHKDRKHLGRSGVGR